MSDRDDFAELVGSARNVTKCSSFYFNGRIRYGTKGEKVEDRFLCMDASRVYICSIKIPVKIESQFNILLIKLIERSSDSHVIIETDEKQVHSLYSLHDKASLQPFLIILIRTLHTVFPHRLQAIVEIRPENEYDKLVRLSNEYFEDMSNDIRPCGGFSVRYECACDFYQLQCHRSIQNLVDTVFAHRTSREFTFREFEPVNQKDWLPIMSALRHNEWFTKLTIENIKLSSENIEELCTVIRLCKAIKDLRLINCGFRQDFGTRFSHCLIVSHIENLDLSNNALEDKGLIALSISFQQRKLPLRSINLQSCSITHKSLHVFHTALINNNFLLKNLQILNLSGNRIKEENCITLLFSNNENILEELHLSDIEFSLESFFHSLSTMTCKLRRLFISSAKSSNPPATTTGGVKIFFTKNQSLEILQLSNANLSNDILRDLCDGLHSNIHLNKLDLRLSGNELESFVRECAHRFATIPCLTALDITGCDLDNEIPTLLTELKKNRKLKSLHLGKNFNNIKTKNMQRTISAMKDLVVESELEYLSIADSKLKENTADFLLSLINNTSVKILDIRGNLMGDPGVRVLTHLLQMNRHLHTIFFDRNLLSLSNFEEIVNAMEENYVIQYLPVPITDIIFMKTTEKDRMEKLQFLMNKLDTLCTRNEEPKENLSSTDSLLVTTPANLTPELSLSWESQQQLIGDQTSLEYILSCSNRLINKQDEVQSILTRTARIAKISSELYEFYANEEERLKDEWNDMCKLFEQKLEEKNERLSRKFYQLFKEQTSINYDDKLQEKIRTFFSNSNDSINHLLNKEMPARLTTYTRECYINVATCLQKKAYDTTNEIAIDAHKQLETTIFQTAASAHQTSTIDGQQHTPSSTLDRLVKGGANVVHRLAHKHTHNQPEITDEPITNRPLRKNDSNECLTDPSSKPPKSTTKDDRLLTATPNKVATPPAPTSPKPPPPPGVGWRRSVLVNTNEPESVPANINAPMSNRMKNKEPSMDDEGDRIEHDLLDIVEQEQQKELQKNTPPAVPMKKRVAPAAQDNSLDVDIESRTKLVHPGRDRPRRANVKPPVRRPTNGASQDSSSDGGLDNDDASIGDISSTSTAETLDQSNINPGNTSTADQQTSELPPKTVAKLFKSASKTPKTANDDSSPPPVPAKTPQHVPTLQARPSNNQQQTHTPLVATNSTSKSVTLTNNDPSQIINSDATHELLQTKPSMSSSSYASLTPSNKDEQKEKSNSSENLTSPLPSVATRLGAIGTRVLPALDPNGDPPPVRLRHFPTEKKVSLPVNPSSTENPTGSDVNSGSGDSTTPDDNEQYRRLSVKERARMLTTTNHPLTSNDKKTTTSPPNTTVTSPYTPRTHRRLTEQVNLFC